ncbi:MAG TPA: acetate--CoA ligase family protein [Steroidobacteraceae bacterium]|jgi:acyl-CoA synthetase (NDP forming)|nr:acetate--CoA ligase family protein [Steroidobacteraceae bacterium]
MSAPALRRLLAPRTVALIGGAWADAAQAASRVIGYQGEVWRIHPTRASSDAQRYFRSVEELPAAPDAAFIAAPNREVPAIAAALARRGAGGFVCFAAGFSETATEEGRRLTQQLLESAGELPFFGPNCYGFINFFDGAALWPDQVVGRRRERGVALICQSGTLALNLLFNDRSLPIGYALTVGNQTRLAAEDLIELLCADERVTAFGLYLEGIQDSTRFAHAVAQARAAGKPIALIKAGRTAAASRTVRTHTGALAGADATFDAFCRQAGVARCESLATLCETLKIFHAGGPLPGRRVLTMGASGGDMAMTADAARHLGLDFAPIPADAAGRLRELLSERVQVANPFDFHTHVWFDYPRQRAMFEVALRAGFDAVGFLVDCPPESCADDSSYVRVIDEFAAALPGAASRAAVICSLPESLSAATREKCLAAGIVPLQGQREALEALDLAAAVGESWGRGAAVELRRPRRPQAGARALGELEAKQALAAYGVPVPHSRLVPPEEAAAAATALGFPVVIKAAAASLEHKSDVGGVVLSVRSAAEADSAARRLAQISATLLVEEMVTDGVAEILVGISVDPQFGQLLVLGAGGVLTELLHDSVTLLPPFTAAAIAAALGRLRVARLLAGYRGRPPGDSAALVQAALACSRYAAAHLEQLAELDLNPVIVRPRGKGAVAVDALIRLV